MATEDWAPTTALDLDLATTAPATVWVLGTDPMVWVTLPTLGVLVTVFLDILVFMEALAVLDTATRATTLPEALDAAPLRSTSSS